MLSVDQIQRELRVRYLNKTADATGLNRATLERLRKYGSERRYNSATLRILSEYLKPGSTKEEGHG